MGMADKSEMVRRQRALADFGEFALRSEDLQEVLAEACRLVAEALNADLAKILEIQRDDDTALVRAGVGWNPGVVGEVRLPLGERSSEGFALEAAKPVVTQDISKEKRFDVPDFLREHGVVALVNVPIFTPGGKAYGLLQVDAREPRDFGDDDTQFLRTYATILGPVIDRLHKVSDLKEARDRNAMLLRELQHRVKNDLTVIHSLVHLRSAGASAEVRKELQIIEERVDTLRLLHQQLYSGDVADRLPLRPYVVSLLENLVALHEDSGPVALKIDVADLEISPDVAGPLGLILNEFATNSFKYGFAGRGGLISVEISQPAQGRASLSVSDDGVGFSTSKSGTGTGMSLINGLSRQIGGKAQWSSNGGVQLRTEFKVR